MEGIYAGYDYELLDVGAVAVGLTTGKLSPDSVAPARGIFISAETASLRFRFDGQDPTAAEGHLLNDTDCMTLFGINNLYAFKAIKTGVANAKLRVTYLH